LENERAYLVPELEAIDTLKLLEVQAAEIEVLRELLQNAQELVAKLDDAIGAMNEARLAEREALEAEITLLNIQLAKAKRKKFALGPSVSYGNTDGNTGWGFGVSLVYSVITF